MDDFESSAREAAEKYSDNYDDSHSTTTIDAMDYAFVAGASWARAAMQAEIDAINKLWYQSNKERAEFEAKIVMLKLTIKNDGINQMTIEAELQERMDKWQSDYENVCLTSSKLEDEIMELATRVSVAEELYLNETSRANSLQVELERLNELVQRYCTSEILKQFLQWKMDNIKACLSEPDITIPTAIINEQDSEVKSLKLELERARTCKRHNVSWTAVGVGCPECQDALDEVSK